MTEKYRRHRLLVPIAGMTLGTIVLLFLLAGFLTSCFDWTASEREQHMVEQGFQRQLEQYQELIVPQADWDKAIQKLDHTFDPAFADVNFGEQLYTFNGFTRTFFIDGNNKVLYASANGNRTEADAFTPFSQVARELLVSIRRAEADRAPIRASADGKATVTKPIQATGLGRIEGRIYIVIATLIQPDIGRILPKGPRAPVALTAKPIDAAMLNSFAARYLVDDLKLVAQRDSRFSGRAYFPLLSPDGRELAGLAWTPRRPGMMLYRDFKIPLVGALLLLGFFGLMHVRRSRVIVDELILSEKQAKHLAYHDQLTCVPNRALLFKSLPRMLATIGSGTPLLAILCVDLDRFKEVNDTLGHQAGDELLRTLAKRLQIASAPLTDALVARLGGDEFVLVCPVNNRDEAERLAASCRDTIAQPMDCDYGQIDVGCSIGVAVIDNGALDPSVVLQRGDIALYQAKAGGRGRVCFFEQHMDDAFRTRRALEASLREALRNDAFRMVYQPQVDENGHVGSVEALLRWHHPELGDISPAVFIPLAEETGLIMAVGEFVLRRVLEDTADWHHLRVAINVSAIQMRAPGYAAQVTQIAAHAGIDPSRYEIELTETALLGDGPATIENFEILRRLGFSLVLDDFGTGYSSLSLLHRFRVDKIKIDRTFVQGLGHSEEINALVRAIVKLAKSFHLGIIAEGVETEEQREYLIAAGCTEFQGFLTGVPMPPQQLVELYERGPALQLQA